MPRTRPWHCWLFLFAIYLLMVAISWKRWANPIVDCGREMYVPWQIAEGKMLYRELFWMYGPLIPYWHALLFKVFGIHLNVLYAVGLLLSTAQTALVFVVARRVLSPLLAVMAGALFLIQFVFRPSLGNLVFPYSFNAEYANILNTAALWLVLRHREGKSPVTLISAGICVGLSLLSKQEIGLAGLAFLMIYSFSLRRQFEPVHPPSRKGTWSPRDFTSSILHPLSLAIIIPLLGYGLFASQIGLSELLHDCLWPRQILAQMKFFEQYTVGTLFGLRAILHLLKLSLAGSGLLLSVLLGACLARQYVHRFAAPAWIAIVVTVLIASPLSETFLRSLELNHLHAANFLLLLIALWQGIRSRSLLGWIALFALLSTWRAPLFAGISAYSSFFMPASVIVFVWFWAEWMPGLWEKIDRDVWRSYAATVFAVICLLQTSRHLVGFRAELTYPIATKRGELFVHYEIGPALSGSIQFLRAHTKDGEPLLLFPEEASLYFLCNRVSPSKYYQFAPGLMPTEEEERLLIDDAETAGVRFVAVSNRATTEYGKPYFGIDYYPDIREWLVANFHVVKTIGKPDRPIPPPPPSRYWPAEGYGIEIYERND